MIIVLLLMLLHLIIEIFTYADDKFLGEHLTFYINGDLSAFSVYYKYIPAYFVNQALHNSFYKQIENRQ